MTAPIAELRAVRKSYDGHAALAGLDLSVRRGEFVAVMGPSGCGKTTALRILAGFERPDTGEVLWHGGRINDVPPWERKMPLVWQNLALFPFLNVVENVEFGLRMRGEDKAARREKAMRWLERLGIAAFAGRSVGRLSGGQRQRVALARTLVTEPDLLLLDEPLSALDANTVLHMQGVLSRLQRDTGVAFLYVTHSRSEAFAMADRVVVMSGGRAQQSGSPRDIYRAPRNRFVARFLGGNNIFRARISERRQGACLATNEDGTFLLPFPDAGAPGPGSTVEFVVAATDARVEFAGPGAGGEEPGNRIACRFVGEEFVGGSVMIHLETAAGTGLMVQVDTARLAEMGELRDRDLSFAWDRGSPHLLEEQDDGPEAEEPE